MLTVYTRHSQKCPHKNDIAWRRCRCPKWIQGTPSEDHEFLRTSAQTRTWEQAEATARQLEESARPGTPKPKPDVTIAEAVAAYRADEEGRCLSKSTTRQSKTLFDVQLLPWAKDVGLTLLKELTTPNLVKFRASWHNGPNTTRRKHERLTGFFEFCISNDGLRRRDETRRKVYRRPDPTPRTSGSLPRCRMKPQPEVATSTCSSTRPFYASLLSVLFTFVDNSRKHRPNLPTGLDRDSVDVTIDRSPDAAMAVSSHQTSIQNP